MNGPTPPGNGGDRPYNPGPRPAPAGGRIEPVLGGTQGGPRPPQQPMPGPGPMRQPGPPNGRGRPPAPPQPPAGRSWLKIAGATVAAILLLAVLALGALYLFLPLDAVRDRIAQQVKERTGRDLQIQGSPRVSFWPRLSVAMSGVSLSNPPGMAAGPTVTMETLETSVQLWPLLSKQVIVDSLMFQKPVVDLRVDASGRRNWDLAEWLAPAGDQSGVRFAQAPGQTGVRTDAGGGGASRPARTIPTQLENLKLGEVRVVDGIVRYTDERSKLTEEAKSVDLLLSAESISAPLDAKGSLAWRGERFDIAGRLTPLRAAIEEKPVSLLATIKGQILEAAYDGRAQFGKDVELDGKLTAKSDAPDRVAKLAGRQIDPQLFGGGVHIATGVKTAAQSVTLRDARIEALGATTTGTVTIETKGPRPYVTGALRFSELDINKLQRLGGGSAAPAPSPANRPPAPGPTTIEDILKQGSPGPAAGPRVRGDERRGGWRTEPLDTSALGLADADLKISFGKLAAGGLRTGQGQASIAHRNRAAKVTVEDIHLYQGRGRGAVNVDGSDQLLQIGANILGESMLAQSLFKDVGGPEWLVGKLRVALAVTAQGQSEYQLVQSLNGRGELQIADGFVIGFNVAQLLRNLGQGRFSGIEASPSEKTDFSEASATFAITNGVARNSDLKVVGPLVRVDGAGSIDLAQRTIDYTARPRIVGSLQGQGAGAGNGAGIEIPVKVAGPLDKPSIAPDISGLVKDPNQVLDTLKNMDRKELEGAVKGLLGGGNGDAQQKGRDLLNQILKR